MKSIIAASLSIFALVGCSSNVEISTQPLDSSSYSVKSLDHVNWQEISVPSQLLLNISESSQTYISDSFKGNIGAFSFAVSQSGVSIEITSPVRDLNVFAPNLAVYDQNFNLIRSYSSKEFDYDRNDFVVGEAFHGEISFLVPLDVTKLYVMVYTTEADLAEKTVLIHPAKAMAIAKRTDPPSIPDPVANHVSYGSVKVSVKQFSPKNNITGNGQTLDRTPFLERAPKASVVSETRNYYLSSIKKSVEAGDIPKALSLLDEAKALGIEDAQEVFVKAVNAK